MGLGILLGVAHLSQIGEIWQDQYIGELLAPGSGPRAAPLELDVTYIKRLIEGDPGAEAHFLYYFQTLLEIRLRSVIKDRALREDLIQETILRTISNLRRTGLKDPGGLRPFVLSISGHVVQEHFSAAGQVMDLADPSESAESELVTAERRRIVAEVLAGLPERERRILHRIHSEGRDKDSVCREFGLSRNHLRILMIGLYRRFRQSFTRRSTKDDLLEERAPLLKAKYKGCVTDDERTRLEDVEIRLREIEVVEADELDKGYQESSMGRIEAALERLEASLELSGSRHRPIP